MLQHLRANLILLVVTVVLCAGVYPLVLWAIGQTVFHDKAEGSLVVDKNGKPIGSRLLAQSPRGPEYFQPRPSAVGYNAAASGASNYAASNYLLRDRVARTLGPIARYKGTPPNGKSVQDDVKNWFAKQEDPVGKWAGDHSGVAQAWVNADDKHKDAVSDWQKSAAGVAAVEEWKKTNPGEPKPADLALPFFKSNAKAFHEKWPALIDDPTWTVPAVFFEAWLTDHPQAALEEVPADMVMASGSGLDPHITLVNAQYQLDRVAAEWAEKTKRGKDDVRRDIEKILDEKKEAPLGGLVGVPLVNVMEVNLALDAKLNPPAK